MFSQLNLVEFIRETKTIKKIGGIHSKMPKYLIYLRIKNLFQNRELCSVTNNKMKMPKNSQSPQQS